jgi:hypothetical protein
MAGPTHCPDASRAPTLDHRGFPLNTEITINEAILTEFRPFQNPVTTEAICKGDRVGVRHPGIVQGDLGPRGPLRPASARLTPLQRHPFALALAVLKQ